MASGRGRWAVPQKPKLVSTSFCRPGYDTRILLFSVNSVLKSLLSALMLLYSYEKMKQISSESTKHDLFLVIFAGIASKLEKVVHPSSLCTDAPSPQKKIITAYVLYKSPEWC